MMTMTQEEYSKMIQVIHEERNNVWRLEREKETLRQENEKLFNTIGRLTVKNDDLEKENKELKKRPKPMVCCKSRGDCECEYDYDESEA